MGKSPAWRLRGRCGPDPKRTMKGCFQRESRFFARTPDEVRHERPITTQSSHPGLYAGIVQQVNANRTFDETTQRLLVVPANAPARGLDGPRVRNDRPVQRQRHWRSPCPAGTRVRIRLERELVSRASAAAEFFCRPVPAIRRISGPKTLPSPPSTRSVPRSTHLALHGVPQGLDSGLGTEGYFSYRRLDFLSLCPSCSGQAHRRTLLW